MEAPPPDRSARNSVLSAGVALALALALLGWWALKAERIPRTFREPAEDPPAAASDAEPAAQPALHEDAPRAPAPGAVIVQAVDVRDGTPAAGVEIELCCEEPLRRRFGRATTDAEGAARFEGVYAPLVLVHARRSSRFAAAIVAVRGEAETGRSALVRLGQGGALSGRVVDELGAPVADIPLSLPETSPWLDSGRVAAPAAVTSADGSWRIERLVDLPRMVTAAGGSVFAGSWTEVAVEARGPAGSMRTVASVLPCRDSGAPDIVLQRPPSIAGRVLDRDRRPVRGALVSVHPVRQMLAVANLHVVDPEAVADGVADLPGMARFRLLAGECLTAEDGSFELAGASARSVVLVALPDGRLEEFPHGSWRAGQRLAGLECALAGGECFRVRLFDAAGGAILGSAPDQAPLVNGLDGLLGPRATPFLGSAAGAWNSSRVECTIELAAGAEERALASPLGDGTFCFAFAAPLASIERLTIRAPGFKPLVREPRGRLRPEAAAASVVLEPLDRLELEIERTGLLEEPPGSDPQELYLRACRLEPESVTTGAAPPGPVCCGSGMVLRAQLTGARQRISLPVLTGEPYWLSIRTSRARVAEELVAGPFKADGELHTFEISALSAGTPSVMREVNVAGRADPRARPARASASLCVFDDPSGTALAGALVWVVCDPVGGETLLARTWTTGADGCAELDRLSLGSWTFAVAAPGHQARIVGPVEIEGAPDRDVELDLGEVRLAPLE